jgi:hypothetical protein
VLVKVTKLLTTKLVIGEQDKTLAYGDGGDGNYSASGKKVGVCAHAQALKVCL